jgi:hypothetical protein
MSNWAELSSIATALDELTKRVTAIAEEANRAKDEGTAASLYDVERTLLTATRRLAKLAAN